MSGRLVLVHGQAQNRRSTYMSACRGGGLMPTRSRRCDSTIGTIKIVGRSSRQTAMTGRPGAGCGRVRCQILPHNGGSRWICKAILGCRWKRSPQ